VVIFLSEICALLEVLPVKTTTCTCPEGYIRDENGRCVPGTFVEVTCTADDDCPTSEACINRICADPCGCGLNADCVIVEHKPVCVCKVRKLIFHLPSHSLKWNQGVLSESYCLQK